MIGTQQEPAMQLTGVAQFRDVLNALLDAMTCGASVKVWS